MKRVLAAAVGLTLFDIASAAAQVSTPVNWTGVYVGVQAGYEWDHGDAGLNCGEDCEIQSEWEQNDGFLAGGHVGFDWSSPSAFVIGIVGDVSFGSGDSSSRFFATSSDGVIFAGALVTGFDGVITVEHRWGATLRARTGYLVSPNALFYLTGGLAVVDEKVSGQATNDNDDTVKWSDARTRLGGTIGAGVEAALAQGLRARVEYLYSDFGSQNYGGLGDPVETEVDTKSSQLKVGFSIALGGP
jgi:outer membrane immunogenic protein